MAKQIIEGANGYLYDVEKDTWNRPMKLYTEEQARKVWKAGQKYWETSGASITLEELLESLTPIELPSDEEIENKGKWVFNDAGHTIYTHYNTVPSWVAGAKWLRDKILKQNK